jgi:hypothetical protein
MLTRKRTAVLTDDGFGMNDSDWAVYREIVSASTRLDNIVIEAEFYEGLIGYRR